MNKIVGAFALVLFAICAPVFSADKASKEVRVSRSATGVSVASAPLLYHTDGDVEAIAARIGETIDWTRIDK